jgi:hypothetical protein
MLNTIDLNYPVPPPTVMDPTAQAVMIWSGCIVVTILLIIAVRMGIKYKTWLPVLFLVAGACNELLEPMVCHLGHCTHAVAGQWTLFETCGRPMPVYIPLAYAIYFGLIWLILYPRYLAGSFTKSFLWKFYVINCLGAFAFEILPLKYGLWVYYDHQAFWFWKTNVPLFWAMVNPVCVLVGFTLICKYHHLMRGWKQLMVIPLSMSGAFMGHFGAGFPYYSAANSAASSLIIDLSGLLSIGFGFLIVWMCIDTLVRKKEPSCWTG